MKIDKKFFSLYFKKLCIAVFGLFLLGISAAMNIKTNFGSDPITVFYDGLCEFFNLNIGIAISAINFSLVAIVFLIKRKYSKLSFNIFHITIVRVIIIRIKSKYRTCHFVHNVTAGLLNDHILHKIGGQSGELVHYVTEHLITLPVRQIAKEQQIGHLGETEAILLNIGIDQILQGVATVLEIALHGFLFAVHHAVALDVAHLGAAHHDAGAVVVAQATENVGIGTGFHL